MRAVIRVALWTAHRLDLGCPSEEHCDLFNADLPGKPGERREFDACRGCPKKLRIPGVPFEGAAISEQALRRVQFLTRLENMVNVGCQFRSEELDPTTWNELIALSIERNWISDKVRVQKEGKDKLDSAAQRKLDDARRDAGVPPPGSSIFPRTRPIS